MGAVENLKTFISVNEQGAALAAQLQALECESKAALAAAIATMDRAKTYVWVQPNGKALVIHFANDVTNLLEVEVLTEEVPDVAPAENVVTFLPPAPPQEEPAPEPILLAVQEPPAAPEPIPAPAEAAPAEVSETPVSSSTADPVA